MSFAVKYDSNRVLESLYYTTQFLSSFAFVFIKTFNSHGNYVLDIACLRTYFFCEDTVYRSSRFDGSFFSLNFMYANIAYFYLLDVV